MPGAMQLRSYQVGPLEARVELLKGLVWKPQGGLNDPMMRQLALAITQGCPSRDDGCELAAIFKFVVDNVRYTGDQSVRDTFQSALRTLQFGGGDCDDHAVLNAVLGIENGFQMRWRITSNTGATWDHIYAMAGLPKVRPSYWVALDTTLHTPYRSGAVGRQPRYAKYMDFLVAKPTS